MSRDTGDHPDLAALSAWAPDLAKTFVSLVSDIALVIDREGVIRNVAQGDTEPIAPGAYQWVGRPWIDTVSGETRPKIEHLMKEVTTTGIARRREVNHLLGSDNSIPVAYTAIRLGVNGPVLAVGRDLRTIAAIQQRYVESQQEIERGYWQARQAEARYQLLFQVATDAVIVVDGQTLQIVEANQAAATLFATATAQLIGTNLSAGFEHHSRGAVTELLGHARTTGQSGEIRVRLQGSLTITGVVATPFRTDGAMRLLVRMRAIDTHATSLTLNRTLSRLVDEASDGVVVTDSSGRTQIANPAFVALTGLESESKVVGQPLMSWLGMVDQPLAGLVSQVRRDGIVRQVDSWVRRASGSAVPVEVAAALLTEGDQECIGFTIRPKGRAVPLAERASETLLRVFRAGIASLGSQLSPQELAQAVQEAAALLCVAPETLELRDGHAAGDS